RRLFSRPVVVGMVAILEIDSGGTIRMTTRYAAALRTTIVPRSRKKLVGRTTDANVPISTRKSAMTAALDAVARSNAVAPTTYVPPMRRCHTEPLRARAIANG